jgi:hypothetical protein
MRKKQKMLNLVQQSESEDKKNEEVLSTPVPKMVTLSAKLINNNSNSNKNNSTHSSNNNHVQTSHRTNEAFSPSTPTPSKQILENNRKKRRSSFAAVQSSVRNSFGASVAAGIAAGPGTNLQSQLLPENVKTNEYHRHIQTDLPGPVKMRQLMIWACKKVAKDSVDFDSMSSKLVEGLLSNEISTSWYQRPIGGGKELNSSDTPVYYLPNPQNQELIECIQLYKNYHFKLEKECEIWEELKLKSSEIFKFKFNKSNDNIKIDNTLNVFFAEEFQTLSKWLNSLPLSVDRLDWNTKLALSFQDHAKQFCEGVFHQIFAKFFSSDLPQRGKAQRIEPMMILRALSTNQTITQ